MWLEYRQKYDDFDLHGTGETYKKGRESEGCERFALTRGRVFKEFLMENMAQELYLRTWMGFTM